MPLLLRPTNRKIRVFVGLTLAVLLAVQCVPSEAFRKEADVAVIEGQPISNLSVKQLAQIELWAGSDHIALLQHCLERYERTVRDYTCTFIKQELINSRTGKQQTIAVKFRQQPFSVAMAWQVNPPQGDRVLFVEGRYQNQMLVRPSANWQRMIVPSALRPPGGEEAMQNTLRPVTQFGFERSLRSLMDVYRLAASRGELKQESGGYARLADRPAIVLIRTLPERPEYRSAAARTVLYIDLEYLVPVRMEAYNWDGTQQCAYSYTDVQFNVGLSDDHFQPKANDMVPPKL